jgi:hypothetical protein
MKWISFKMCRGMHFLINNHGKPDFGSKSTKYNSKGFSGDF